jgi:hypothetical protein
MALRDLKIGRLQLLTYENDFTEALGDEIQTVGGGVVPGSRRPRPLKFTVPVHGGSGDADPYTTGARMRRQVVALMENTLLKLQALYVAAAPDPDINGWFIIGTGDLAYGDGGPSLEDYKLTLGDSYRVATRRTHRGARRVALYDRRLSTTARDYLQRFFTTDYGALTAVGVVYLPVGATDIVGLNRVPYVGLLRTGQGGATVLVTGAAHAEVLSYEQVEASMHLQDDVVIYDRRGRGDIPQGYGGRIQQDAPAAWWRLDEAAGATAAADAGAAGLYGGTYQGAPQLAQPSLTQDPGTYSAGLSGRDGMYVKVADAVPLRFTGDMSYEGIVRPVTGIANLVPNGTFEADIVGWSASGDTAVTVGTFARITSWSAYGTASLRMAATSTAGAAGTANAVAVMQGGLDAQPVLAGRTYSARAELNVIAAGQGSRVSIVWADSTGTALGQVDGTVVTGTGLKTVTCTATAPANTAYAYLQVRTIVGTSGSTDVYIDGVTLAEAAAAVAWTATRPRYDVIASKWQAAAAQRSYRFAYDYYFDKLVVQLSSNGSLQQYAYSNALGLAAAAAATGGLAKAHLGAAYNAAAGRVTFFYNGAQVGQVTGMPTAVFAASTTLDIGKWDADLV